MVNEVNTKKKQKGFSLIELLVVVAILGILSAAGGYAYTQYLETTRRKVHEANAGAFAKALETALISFKSNLGGPCANAATSVDGGVAKSCADILIPQLDMKSPWDNSSGTSYIKFVGDLNSSLNSCDDQTGVTQKITLTPQSSSLDNITPMVCTDFNATPIFVKFN